MKKTVTKINNSWMHFYVLIIALLISLQIKAANEISVTATAGTVGPTLYSSLSGAGGVFAAINAGTHKGVITVSVTASESTETGANALNASGSGAASYTGISIQPNGGGAWTISGSVAGAMITLNAANYVTIDGLNTGGNALTILNSDSGALSSTIHFVGVTNSTGASNNLIQNCTITGAGTGTTKGTILFDAGLNTANTINNCIIASDGTTSSLATNAIYASGFSAADNSANSITNCNISDYFNAAASSFGIYISNDCSNGGWTITGNTFFQSNTRTSTGGPSVIYGAISIGGSGDGWNVSGNIIGYAAPNHTGTMTYACAAGGAAVPVFRAIQILGVGTTSVSNFNNDTISNISFTTNSVLTSVPGIFNAIYGAATTGLLNIGSASSTGNVISNISINSNNTGTGKTGILASVIYITSTAASAVNIQGNDMATVSCQSTDTTSGFNFTGIFTNGTAGFTVSNNTIGDTAANNISIGTLAGTAALQTFYGVRISSSGSVTVDNNTLQNLTSYCNTAAAKGNTAANVMGGLFIASGTGIDVSGNSISKLTVNDITATGSNAGGSVTINGISVNSAGNTINIQNNSITKLSAYGQKTGGGSNQTSASTTVNGILVSAGTNVIVSNNGPISNLTATSSDGASSSTAGTSTINGILVSTASISANVNNNSSITGFNAASFNSSGGSAAASTVNGISVTTGAGAPATVNNNATISNLLADGHESSNQAPGITNVYGILVSSGSTATVNNNGPITGITADSYTTSNANGTNYPSNASGIKVAAGTTIIVNSNLTIRNVTANSYTTGNYIAGPSYANGIYLAAGTSVTVDSNATIYGVTANSWINADFSNGNAYANGIYVKGVSATININDNDSVSTVLANATNTSGWWATVGSASARGIFVSGSPTANITIDKNKTIFGVTADCRSIGTQSGQGGVSNAFGILDSTGATVSITNTSGISNIFAKSSSSTGNTAPGLPGSAYGIDVTVATGAITITGNTGINTLSSDASASGKFAGRTYTFGILVAGTGGSSASTIYGNSISNLTANSTGSIVADNDTAEVYGISVSGGSSTIIGNSLSASGNSISNLTATGAFTGTLVVGISATSGTPTIQNNVVSTLSSNTTNAGTGAGDAMIGILTNVASTGQIIDGNTVKRLTVTGAPSASVNIDGILVADTGSAGNVTRNTIDSLSNSSTSAGSSVNGIHVNNSAAAGWNVVNNMIALKNTDAAASVNGAMQDGGACNFYFNSIYISGSATAQASYALLRADSTSAIQIVDNILINNRGTGITVNNYAIGYVSATGWIAANSDFNDLVSSGTSIGNAAGAALSFVNWLTGGADVNSLNTDVSASFTNPSTGDLHLPPNIILPGISRAPGWVTDFDNEPRPLIPRMGADDILPTAVMESSPETFGIYPNPAGDQFTVYGLRFTGEAMLEIYDILGNKVYSRQFEASNLMLQSVVNISNLAPGLYSVLLLNNESKQVSKLVKE